MVKHTEEEVINYIKGNMIDSDGVMVINKTHPSWVYDYLRHRLKTPESRVAWVREKTGALLWVAGYNTPDVIKQRLRANNLIKIEKVDGKLVERLYSDDLNENHIQINTVEEQIRAQKIEKLRKMIKDNANKNGLSAKEYVESKMGIFYVNHVMFKSLEDVNNWIIENMKGKTDANTLRKIDGYNNARDYIKNNWKIQNEMYSSPIVDYLALNFPEYRIDGMIQIEKDVKKEYYYNVLWQEYPSRVIERLKTDNKKLYEEIKLFRKTTKGWHDKSIKEFIEDYIGEGMFVYVTKSIPKASKWDNTDYILRQLVDAFGIGDVNNPLLIKLSKNRTISKNIGYHCDREGLTTNQFLNPLGYRVDNERQIGVPSTINTSRVNTTHNERNKDSISTRTLTGRG